jgi:SagB-type dehydrogenase family enzyme
MDPANRPLPFKVYRDVPLLPFAESWDALAQPATEALVGQGGAADPGPPGQWPQGGTPPSEQGGAADPGPPGQWPQGGTPPSEQGDAARRQPTRADVERVCHFSNGVLRWRKAPWLPGGRMAFRAAPCTGALYHIELYLACADLEGLPAGLYHYCARDSGFRCLRRGDWRALLIEAAAGEKATAEAPAVLLVTSTFWRNAWKYGARAYRHTYWDGGVIVANALAVAHALELPAKVVMGFVDAAVNQLIDVDPDREAAIALVTLGEGASAPRAPAGPHERIGLATDPLSAYEERFDVIPAAHAATSLTNDREVRAWRRAAQPAGPADYRLTSSRHRGGPSIEEAIIRRRSTRSFAAEPITRAQLLELLACAMAPIPSDAGIGPGSVHIAASAVEGMDPGTYLVEESGLTLIRTWPERDIRAAVMRMSLDQQLAAEASVNVAFLADLDAVLDRLGDRGWRAVHMGAAIAAGRLEVAAQALGLGATGLTFFDDEVAELFGLGGARTGVCYLAAVGVPARPR